MKNPLDLSKLPREVRLSLQAMAAAEAIQQVEADSQAEDLQKHLDKRVLKGYLSSEEFQQYDDALNPPEWILAREDLAQSLLDTAWTRYQGAIERTGNPPDQIANFERAGVILQAKQLEFAYHARQADHKAFANQIGFGGARGPGKSFVVFAQVVLDDCQRFPGLKVLYLRKSGKAAQEQLRDLMKAVMPRLISGKDYDYRERPTAQISFSNGSFILIGHFQNEKEALNYQGQEYDIVIIEETTHLTLSAYKDLRSSSRSSKTYETDTGLLKWRARVYNTTNPLGPGHQWYKKRFVDPERNNVPLEEREQKTVFIFATVYDNRFIDEEYRIDNLEDLDGVKKEAFLEGNWDVSAGAYFARWSHKHHVVDDWLVIPPEAEVWVSKDYGFVHWNQTYLLAKIGEMTTIVHELSHRLAYPHDIAPDILQMLAQYKIGMERLSVFLAGSDVFRQSGNYELTIAQQYAEFGIYLTPADNRAGSRAAGAQVISRMLGNPEAEISIPNTLQICRRCVRLIDTLPYLEHDPNNLEDVRKVDIDDQGRGGDDPYDAMRYGLHRPHVSSMWSSR